MIILWGSTITDSFSPRGIAFHSLPAQGLLQKNMLTSPHYPSLHLHIYNVEHIAVHAGFLCPISANTYGIEFLNFVISDYEVSDINGEMVVAD